MNTLLRISALALATEIAAADNLVENGDFESGIEPWTAFSNITPYSTNPLVPVFDVVDPTTGPNHLIIRPRLSASNTQVYQDGLEIILGQEYLLCFLAYSTARQEFSIALSDSGFPLMDLDGGHPFWDRVRNPTETLTPYFFKFRVESPGAIFPVAYAKLLFWFSDAKVESVYGITNVVLAPIGESNSDSVDAPASLIAELYWPFPHARPVWDGEVILIWDPIEDEDLCGYVICRNGKEIGFSVENTFIDKATDYDPILGFEENRNRIFGPPDIDYDTDYEYSVKAVYSAGVESRPSEPVSIRTPPEPENLIRNGEFTGALFRDWSPSWPFVTITPRKDPDIPALAEILNRVVVAYVDRTKNPIGMGQSLIPLEPNSTYQLSFAARSQFQATMDVCFGYRTLPGRVLKSATTTLELTGNQEWQDFILYVHTGNERLQPQSGSVRFKFSREHEGDASGPEQMFNVDHVSLIRINDPTIEPPNPPQNAVGQLIGNVAAKLTWDPPQGDHPVAGYFIYCNGQEAGMVYYDTSMFVHGGFEPGEAYTYTITAFDLAGNESGPSNLVTIATADPPPAGLEKIADGGFEGPGQEWALFDRKRRGARALDFDKVGPGISGDRAAKVLLSNLPGAPGALYLSQGGIELEPFTKYNLVFSTKCSTEGDVEVSLFDDGPPYHDWGINRVRVPVGTEWQTHLLTFTTTKKAMLGKSGRLVFAFDRDGRTRTRELCVDAVSITKATD